MNIPKKRLMLAAALITSVILATVWFAFAKDMLPKSEADMNLAADLAALSGLPQETVLRIYDHVENWDTVRDYIFVYKKILTLVPAESEAYDTVFDQFGLYKATDVLTVYEFLANKGYPFGQAETMLADYAKGINMETVLAEAGDTKTYLNYKPAGEEEIRSWLADQYLPEDILYADEIARAKDMSLAAVLAEKTPDLTWQQVGTKLNYEFKAEPAVTVSMAVYEGVRGKRVFKGKDYKEAVDQINRDAKVKKDQLETQVAGQTGLDQQAMADYQDQGFNLHEINNAYKLSQKSGAEIHQILQERKDGSTWEQIIAKYTGTKTAETGEAEKQ